MTADSTSSNSGPGRQPHLNRLLLRDQEIQRMYHAATRWLAAQWPAAQANPKGAQAGLASPRGGARRHDLHLLAAVQRVRPAPGQHQAAMRQQHNHHTQKGT